MTTSSFAVVFFAVILMMAASVAIMTVVYAFRLPSTRARKNTMQNKVTSLEEIKSDEGVPLPVDVNDSLIHAGEDTYLPGEKTAGSSVPVAQDATPENNEAKAIIKKLLEAKEEKVSNITPLILPADSQAQPNHNSPVLASETQQRLSEDPVLVPSQGIPQQQVPEPGLSEALQPPGSSQISSDTVRAENISTTELNREETGEENKEKMVAKPNNEANTSGSNPSVNKQQPVTANATESAKVTGEEQNSKNSGMGDLSDLFAKGSSEDKKANKLADEMNDIDASDLLRDSLGLISRLKKK